MNTLLAQRLGAGVLVRRCRTSPGLRVRRVLNINAYSRYISDVVRGVIGRVTITEIPLRSSATRYMGFPIFPKLTSSSSECSFEC